MRGFKMMFGLGVALVLGLAGIGQARVEAPSGFLPLDWPEGVDGVGLGSATRTIPDPSHERSAQRTLHESPERLTFTSGGHVLRFAPDHLLTAGTTHALKVEFVGANPVVPQSDAPAGDNPVGSALRTIPDPSSEWSAQRTLQDSPLPSGEGRGVRAEGTQGFRSFPRFSLGTGVAKSQLPGDLGQQELAEQGSQAGAWEPAKPAENRVGSALRTIPDPSSEWSAQRTLQDSPRPLGEGLGVRAEGTQGLLQNQKAPPLTEVRYPNLWQGIDLSYRAAPGGIAESIYQLQPGADIGQVRLRYNRPLSLDAEGRLNIRFDTGTLTESAPIAWQEREGERQAVSVAFVQHGEQELGFRLGAHDPSRALWIDPTLEWNTFLGGSGEDWSLEFALDSSSNIYVTGGSYATWGSPLRAHSGQADAFVAKLSPTGALLWNTFLGGSAYDRGSGLAVDGSGQVYVTGGSYATWGSPLRAFSGGGYDAFVAKLDTNGALLWHSFLGGGSGDWGSDIALDSSGNVYVAGNTATTWGSPLRAFGGGNDAFVAKLSPTGALLWNTFLGGSSNDWGSVLALDGSGNVYVIGYSSATWGSPLRAFSGSDDAFVAKLSPAGALLWNTFLGGSDRDWSTSLALDSSGNLYVTGWSIATWGSPLRAHSGNRDAFVAKLGPTGALLWNTFLGSSANDEGFDLALDSNGHVFVSGYSSATWGSPLQAYSGGSFDVFVAKLDTNGTLLWHSFLGSNPYCGQWGGVDFYFALALDSSNNIYVSGESCATWGNPLRAFGGGFDAFVAKLSDFFALTVGTSGSGTLTSSPAGINCGADCSENYSSGTLVTLTASPASGWQFSGWSGDCSGNGGCSVTMNTNRNVTATFTAIPVTYTLTVGKNGSGTLTSSPSGIDCGGDCSESYSSGTLVTLTATPASGWQFSGWSGDCSGNGGCSVTMNTNRNVTATFTAIPVTYTLTVGKNGSGTLTSSPAGINCGADCSENYSSGTLVTLTASPASGWQFSGWSGDCSGNGGCSVTMNTNRNVTATFTAIPVTYTLTVGKNGSGTLTSSPAGINCGADCSENYSSGTLVTLTASPASGWQFSGWSGDCSGNGGCSVTMNTAKNVVANFALSQSISDALDNINLIWTTGGGASWLTQLIESVLGGKAVQSGVISDNQTSYLRTSAEGPGWVRFWWKVSSEEGYDFLRFYIDDQLQVGISGEQDWIQETFSLTSGLHTLVWAYEKDWSRGVGRDAGWVDAVEIGQSSAYQLDVSIVGNGWLRSWPPGIDTRHQGNDPDTGYEGPYKANFPAGTQVTLSPVNDGHNLSAWGDACEGSEPVCNVYLVEGTFVSATFTSPAQFVTSQTVGDTGAHPSLTVSSLGKGWVDGVLSSGGATDIVECRSETGQGRNCYDKWPGAVSVVVNATPDPGNRFLGWQGDACAGVTERQCTLIVQGHVDVQARFETEPSQSYSLQVQKTGNGSVSGGSINCGNQCTATYTKGNGVSLNASPASGYSFNGWSGDCGGTSCQLTMNGPKEVTANFVPTSGPSYPLTIAKPSHGTVRTPGGDLYCGSQGNACAKDYPGGTSLNLQANADTGYYFDAWGGACSGKSGCSLSLDGAKTVNASFLAIPPINYQLSLSVDSSGVVGVAGKGNCSAGQSCSYSYTGTTPPTQASLTATPNSGYRFNGWSGDCAGQGNPCSFAMSQNRTATASFAVNSGGTAPPRLQVYTSGQGAVSGPGISCGADCSETYSLNQSVQLTASAQGGSRFGGWGGACSGTNATCNLQMGYDKSVTAQFIDDSANTRTLSVNVSGLGTVSTDENPPKIDCRTSGCQASYETWQNAKLYAEPDPGKSFLGWGGACSGWGTGNTCVLSMSAHQQVSASFTQGSAANHTLTVNKNGSGTVSGPGINCGADCSESYSSGTAVTLNATPATGWQFSGWSGDCSGQGACTLNMTAAKNATANFSYQGGGANPNPNPNPSLRVGTDTDGDGKADILWRNIATGENWRYRMNGSSIQGSNPINTVSNLDWKIAGIGDFNGDGKADILWRNSSTGENWLYLMNGNGIQGSNPINTVSNLDWKIAGVGDLDGDGKADILWRNSVTGENWLYRMNGNSIQGSNPVNTVSNLDWKIVGVSDFDGDGKADILWRNSSTGENWLYLMNGNSIQGSNPINTVSNLDWKIAGIGDFDGDGKADILWRNSSTGENWLYRMNGYSIQGSNPVNTVSNLDWKIVLVSDFDGDGKADILWRNSVTGENWLYRMNGNSIQGSNPINTVSNLNWQIQGGGGN